MKKVIETLKSQNKTIATMESCTGGALASAITNIAGASQVFQFGAVTYSNQFKIKMGVDPQTIEEYSVYSKEVAKEMSHAIALIAKADYGLGITGKLNWEDENNPYGIDNLVYLSIYDTQKNCYHAFSVSIFKETREQNKEELIQFVTTCLENILLPQ